MKKAHSSTVLPGNKKQNQSYKLKYNSILPILFCSALLSACGGGSGGKDPVLGTEVISPVPTSTVPTPPVVVVPPVTPVPPTSPVPDTTLPTVVSTVPVDADNSVATNSQVVAVFSEDMDPTTINGSTFTLMGTTQVVGTVSYSAASRTMIFTPTTGVLTPSTSFTGNVTTGVKDLAGNAMAANYMWTFRTQAAADTTPPTVTSTNPLDGAVVCSNKTINATFSEPMDPTTINASTFTVQPSGPPLGANISGVVSYNTVSQVATFTPASLNNNANYTATINIGVKDLAGNAATSNKVVTFTTKLQPCASAPVLGAAASFGSFGGSATVTNDGLNTIVNGDVGVLAASTKITGFRDNGGNVYTVTTSNDGKVNGLVYTLTAPPGSVAGAVVTQAKIDAQKAFDSISPAVLPGGIDVSSLAQCPSCGGAGGGADELAGRTLPAGVYMSTTGTYDIGGPSRTTADLVLDGEGDTNAVWIFQTAAGTGTLNVGLTGPATPAVPIRIRLINGAQAKNVFWYAPAGAVINTGSTMVGTILADAAITMSTTGGTPPTAVLTTVNGRAISLASGVTMTNTVINVPSP